MSNYLSHYPRQYHCCFRSKLFDLEALNYIHIGTTKHLVVMANKWPGLVMATPGHLLALPLPLHIFLKYQTWLSPINLYSLRNLWLHCWIHGTQIDSYYTGNFRELRMMHLSGIKVKRAEFKCTFFFFFTL